MKLSRTNESLRHDADRARTAIELLREPGVLYREKRSDKEARSLSLGALAEEAVRAGLVQLIIGRDESLERADRRLSDPVVRCYSNDGDWVRRVDAIVDSRVTQL